MPDVSQGGFNKSGGSMETWVEFDPLLIKQWFHLKKGCLQIPCNFECIRPELAGHSEQYARSTLHQASAISRFGSLDHMSHVCESHARLLIGQNGHSLVTRVAMLEDAEQSRKWSLRAIWGAVISMLVKVLHDILRNGR